MPESENEKEFRRLLAGAAQDKLLMSTREAMNSPHSNLRWPFELLQNAHDAGPESGQDAIDVTYTYDSNKDDSNKDDSNKDDSGKDDSGKGTFTFSHNGRPFKTQDAFTVITGNSSKSRATLSSEQTSAQEPNTQVGRYGTGFLTTHTISMEVDVSGVLQDDGKAARAFSFRINRSTDNNGSQIYDISQSYDQFVASHKDPEGVSHSARFEYKSAAAGAVASGLKRLVGSIPALFATCDKIGSLTIEEDGARDVWRRSRVETETFGQCTVDKIVIDRDFRGQTESIEVLRFALMQPKAPARRGCAIVALRDGQLIPGEDDADWRGLYRTFPLLGDTRFRLPIAIDGVFEVDNSRSKLLVGRDKGDNTTEARETREAAGDAVKAMGCAIQYLISNRVPKAAECARFRVLGGEFAWWDRLLAEVCCELVTAPVAWTTDGELRPFVSGSDDDPAMVYVPRAVVKDEAKYDTNQLPDKATAYAQGLRDFYRLLELDGGFTTVSFDDALAWRRNFESWESLPLDQTLKNRLEQLQLTIAGVAKMMSETVEGDSFLNDTADNLPAEQNRHDWLILLWQLVGFCWRMGGPAARDLSPLDGFVPCQDDIDTNPPEDKPDDFKVDEDADIPLELKDAADYLEVECRARLLDPMFRRASDLVDEEGRLRFPDLGRVIGAVTGGRKRTARDVVKACTDALSLRFNQLQGKQLPVEQTKFYSASERFALTLWHLDKAEYKAEIAGLKWLSSDGRSAVEKHALLPVASWPDDTKAYACVFPEKHILHERYTNPNTLAMLESCISLTHSLKNEKKVRFWADVQGTVSGDRVLHTDPVKKAERMKRLTAFVDFHVNYLAEVSPRDEISLHSDGWAKDFASLPFIHSDDAGKIVSEKATADTLTKAELNNPDWFSTANRRTFLVECLKFKRLDVSTRCLTKGDGAKLQSVEDVLANICDNASRLGDDYLEQLRGLVEATVTQTTLARRLEALVQVGHSIEAIVREVLSNEFGADAVKKAHVGHDIRVMLSDDAMSNVIVNDVSVGTASGGIPEYVEVKSTTSRSVRMTRTQADLAVRNSDNYTLCVVDAEGLEALLGPDDESESERKTRLERLIRDRARFVNKIGHLVFDAGTLIEEIAEQSDASVSVESRDLKVRVKSEVWTDDSLDFDGWIRYLRDRLAGDQVGTEPLGGE